ATLPEEDERRVVITERAPIIDSVPLTECLENEWVAPFQIYNLPVLMYSNEDDEYQALNREFHSDFAVFGHDFHRAMACVQSEYERNRVARETGYDIRRVNAAAFRWMKNVHRRKELLYTLRSKHDRAAEIIEMFPDRLTVTFSQSIESAELMASLLG